MTELTFCALVAVNRPDQDEFGRRVQDIPEHAKYIVIDRHREEVSYVITSACWSLSTAVDFIGRSSRQQFREKTTKLTRPHHALDSHEPRQGQGRVRSRALPQCSAG